MSTVTFKLPAGIRVREKVENLIGIITIRCERLNGCIQYLVDPPRKEDGTIITASWADFENLEIIDNLGKKIKPEKVAFKFETGDFVRNLIHKKEGIISVRRIDMNGCVQYWYENGEQNPKTGQMLEFVGFEQEFEFIDRGLNKPVKKKPAPANVDTGPSPIKRQATGCRHIESSGKY